MLDFLSAAIEYKNNGTIMVYPVFKIIKSKDLMVKGNQFYAIYDEDTNLWVTDYFKAIQIISRNINDYVKNHVENISNGRTIVVDDILDDRSGAATRWVRYIRKFVPNNFTDLDTKLAFSNSEIKKEDYSSKRLSYALSESPTPGYDKLMSVIYSPEERHKLEWAIGSIISGDSTKIQKFIVMVGDAGTGKSTVIKIIQMLFDGYWSVFDAKALGNPNASFALEPLKSNPLVALQDDADLSNIQDNTRLNSLISHEHITVNAKFASLYELAFRSFVFLGTNKDVFITDARSGLLRRLIDVEPTGEKLSSSQYFDCMDKIKFELGGIAYHCLQVYLEDKKYYDNYIPIKMFRSTNTFYNFVEENLEELTRLKDNSVELTKAWTLYKEYTTESKLQYSMNKRQFKNELMSYYKLFIPEGRFDGKHYRNLYCDFRYEKIGINKNKDTQKIINENTWLKLDSSESIFDLVMRDQPAQYATINEKPSVKWSDCKSTLEEIDTKKLHYVKVPENHIVIDFDIKNEKGEKDYILNLEAASKFPPTYAEVSKGGKGIHLHYIYDGDVNKLSMIYDENIEVKVFKGNSSLRRKLTMCNNLHIATINSGLPLKGDDKVVNFTAISNEKAIRTIIKRNLNKEYLGATKPSVDFIFKTLEDAYNNGVKFDVTDMRPAVMAFANNSTNNAEYCVKIVSKMHFKSDEPSEEITEYDNDKIIFYDVEVFPNLFVVVWKFDGAKECIRLINPTPSMIESLIKGKLIGFNNRRYDNHILYACMMGYTNQQLYNLSQRIINGSDNALFGEAYNISYTDIYDFASAGNKKSLKKLEIEMGIHHQELGMKWDEPVPEDKWNLVAEYCENDVQATEAAFYYLKGDWTARKILSDLAGMSVNSSTNSLTQKIIFGNERNPQSEFRYRNLAEPVYDLRDDEIEFLKKVFPKMMSETHGDLNSQLPYFPEYRFDNGKSFYKGEEIGEGGEVYSERGLHCNVALLDVTSMHAHSAIAEIIFGLRFTKRFYEIVYGRVDIKHEEWEEVNNILDGKLTPYIQDVINGNMTSKELADALKTAVNAVYGQTAAGYSNPFRDPRNLDNIVAKRGALFMIDLKEAVQAKGFTVAHIKTDSIKIPNATTEIINFVIEFGEKYGYYFEHEATYEKMCLVNDSVYIAKYLDCDKCKELYNYVPGDNKKHFNKHNHPWTATGTQFQVPYVFKTLFSKEPITFDDMCETKSVKTSIYLDFNEQLPEGEHNYVFIGKVGQFTPVKSGLGGGILLAERDGKYNSVTGTKGYRWMDSEVLREKENRNEYIDKTYYNKFVDEASEDIGQYIDINEFVECDSYSFMNNEEEIPFDQISDEYFPMNEPEHNSPCGEGKVYGYCANNCEFYNNGVCSKGYEITTEDELPFV